VTGTLLPASVSAWSGPVAVVLALVALVVAAVRPGRRPPAPRPVSDLPGTEAIELLSGRLDRLDAAVATAFQRAALVRFDAFPGSGGQMSFALALLDANRRGLLLTAISGREETRVYTKWVEDGRSVHPLSPEEEDALRRALAPGDEANRRREG